MLFEKYLQKVAIAILRSQFVSKFLYIEITHTISSLQFNFILFISQDYLEVLPKHYNKNTLN